MKNNLIHHISPDGMVHKAFILWAGLLLTCGSSAHAENPTVQAAERYVKGVNWQVKSIVASDFTCRGKKENAILGTNKEDIVIAVFINGLEGQPEVLRFSAQARNPNTARLKIESLSRSKFTEIFGEPPLGVLRNRHCKGLNLSDGERDSAHIYWDNESKQFGAWVLG